MCNNFAMFIFSYTNHSSVFLLCCTAPLQTNPAAFHPELPDTIAGNGWQLFLHSIDLPYLGVCAMDDPTYQRTRKFVLSESNPYYYKGEFAKGVGSPHTPKGYIWPIALCVQAMTSDDLDEIAGIVDTLMHTHAGCECMHESFDPDAPEKFTREWFAWANSMFGELIFRLYEAGTLDEVLRRARKLREA